MLFNTELLERLERNEDLKKAYAGQGSFGQNKLIALPIIIGFFSAFAAYSFYGISKTDPSYSMYVLISVAIIVACIVAVVMMQAKAKKSVLANLDQVKACLAKKIYGNDQTQVYYSIYTLGKMRHDADFLESIADKIFNIDAEPDKQLQSKINKLFQANLEGMNAAPVLLPVAFTHGEEVYKKEFTFSALDPQMQENIKANNDQFIALSFHSGSAILLRNIPI
jgi:heme exporter protein D